VCLTRKEKTFSPSFFSRKKVGEKKICSTLYSPHSTLPFSPSPNSNNNTIYLRSICFASSNDDVGSENPLFRFWSSPLLCNCRTPKKEKPLEWSWLRFFLLCAFSLAFSPSLFFETIKKRGQSQQKRQRKKEKKQISVNDFFHLTW